MEEMSIGSLRAGQSAFVTGLGVGTSVQRLSEIGFVPGVEVHMVRHGDPCIVRVEHSRMSLGRRLQEAVLVRCGVLLGVE